MKKAWIENSIIRDIAQGNPSEIYHPTVAILYSEDVPDNAENGDSWNGTSLTKPIPIVQPEPAAPIVIPPSVSPVEFKLLFTSQERVAIKASADPIVQDFFEIVNDPRLTKVDLALASTQNALGYLETVGLIAEGRKEEILLGTIS